MSDPNKKFFNACRSHDLSTIETLVKEGYKLPTIHECFDATEPDAIEFLLQNGGNINEKDQAGNTMLHKATETGWIYMVELLKEHGAKDE